MSNIKVLKLNQFILIQQIFIKVEQTYFKYICTIQMVRQIYHNRYLYYSDGQADLSQ